MTELGESPAATVGSLPGRARRWRAPAVVVAAVGLGVGATLAATIPWADAPSPVTAPGASADEPAEADEPEPGDGLALPARRFVLDPVPDGFVAFSVQDAALDPNSFGFSPAGTSVLLAAPEATYADGPWLTVATTSLSDMGGGPFDPANFFPGASSRPVSIGTYTAAIGDSFSGDPLLQFGPAGSDAQLVVALQARGLSQNDLVAIGSRMQFGADDRPRIDPDALPMPMAVLLSADRSVGSDPTGFLFDGRRSVTVTYGSADPVEAFSGEGGSIIVSIRPADVEAPLGSARFFLSDAAAATVNGNDAVVGSAEAFTGFGNSTVVWVDGGEVISITVGEELDAVAVAQTVRAAEGAEWSRFTAGVEEFQRRAQEAQRVASRTWLIDAGELDDATTWVAEGNFSDRGVFFVGVAEFGSDGSSSSASGGGFGGGGPTELPSLRIESTGSHSSIIFALAPLDQLGAVVRITYDDSTTEERALHVVRPEWPALAAAIGFEATAIGRVELVAADGSILAEDVLPTRLDAGSDDGAFGSAGTVAAAGG